MWAYFCQWHGKDFWLYIPEIKLLTYFYLFVHLRSLLIKMTFTFVKQVLKLFLNACIFFKKWCTLIYFYVGDYIKIFRHTISMSQWPTSGTNSPVFALGRKNWSEVTATQSPTWLSVTLNWLALRIMTFTDVFLVIAMLSGSYTFHLLTFDTLCIQKTS